MRARRFVAAFLAALSLPLLGTLALALAGRAGAGQENRTLAPAPGWPDGPAALARFPGRADAWIDDRFGLRGPLIALDHAVLWHVFGELATDRLVPGRRGRLFLGSHDGAPRDSLITDACGVGIPDALVGEAADAARTALGELARAGLRPTLLIVPTASRLYPDDLPPRLARACASGSPSGDRLAALLAGSDVVYPLRAMQGLDARGIPAIPPGHFHWAGEAPLRIAEAIAEARWHLARAVPIPLRTIRRRSDLDGINPGMGLSDRIREPQLRAIGATHCVGAACAALAGLAPSAARAIEHDERPGNGPTLLLIADSFGDEIERDFLEQFREVWTVHTNLASGAPGADRAALARWIAVRFAGDRALMVYHDAGAVRGLGRALSLLAFLPRRGG